MHVSTQLAALIAIMSVGVIYGTDAFCALVQRPALARVDDTTLTAVMGNVHRFGDRRLPVPGMLGMIACATACVLSAIAGRTVAAATAGAALVLLLSWLMIYLRISAPINRALTSAADGHQTPTNARSLQHDWDQVIALRATLQGLAVVQPSSLSACTSTYSSWFIMSPAVPSLVVLGRSTRWRGRHTHWWMVIRPGGP
jgi:Domain of unknown function (DUF1772)